MPRRKRTGLELLAANFWLGELMFRTGAKNPSQIPEKLTHVRDTVISNKDISQWYCYASQEIEATSKKSVPSRELVERIDSYYKYLSKTLYVGPNYIIKVMTTNQFQVAASLIFNELMRFNQLLNDLGNSSHDVVKNLCDPATKMIGLAEASLKTIQSHSFGSRANEVREYLPLVLCIAYTEQKFLDRETSLRKVLIPCLDFIFERYRIPFHAWSFDKYIYWTFLEIERAKNLRGIPHENKFFPSNGQSRYGKDKNTSNYINLDSLFTDAC